MFIEWDGMTNTERRTHDTVTKVVSAVEGAMKSVRALESTTTLAGT